MLDFIDLAAPLEGMSLLVVALVALTSFLAAADGHTCIHNTLNYPIHTAAQPHVATLRAMSPQAVSYVPIRILLNYTFVDDVSLDVSASGNPQVCQSVGQKIIVGTVSYTDNPCLDANGNALAVSNCYFICNTSDIPTPSRIAKAKEVIDAAKARYQQMLKVQDLGDVTVGGGYVCGGLNVANQSVVADVVILPTVRSTPYIKSTLAFATPCQIHEVTSRPILMHVNIQPSTLESNSDMSTVVTHEMTHGFGFSVDMYKFYRHPNDVSKTYLEYDPIAFPYGPLQGTAYSLYNDNVNGRYGPRINYTALGAGKKVELISPNVIATAKDFFACDTIDSVELENNGASSSAGTHWEERIMYWELMTSVQKNIPGKLTNFTLSLFKDMGFYDVVRTNADPMDFGFKKGCSFVQKLCNESDWYFCDEPAAQTCGYNNQYIGGCNAETRSVPFPISNRYFPGEPLKGGSNDYLDNCPFAIPLSDGACTVQGSYDVFVAAGGNSSRCYVSTFVRMEYNAPATANVLCFATLCKNESVALLKLENELYECVEGGSVELAVFPRFTTLPSAKTNVTGKARYSALGYGVIQCPNPVPTCNPQVADLNPDIISIQGAYPTLKAVSPFFIEKSGGSTITIVGTGLAQCTGIRLGGLAATAFTVINDTHANATVSAITYGGKYGGADSGGLGYSQADLQCSVTNCTNCFVGSVPIQFVEDDGSGINGLASTVADFFQTTTGLVVAILIGVVVLGLVAVCIKQMCSSPKAEKKSSRRGMHKEDDFSQEML